MLIMFFIGFVWLAYIYAGYPFLLAILVPWKRVHPKVSASYIPSVSVLIAARNEEKDIGWKIAETLNWDYPAEKLEIFVGSDASDDSTDQIVEGYAAQGVRLVRMLRRGGKVRALNQLEQLARGEVLFFTDANAHIEPHTLRLMVRHFVDPKVGCVTGDSRPIEERHSPALSRGAEVYWGYETILKRLESSIGSVLVCDGAIFCQRANLFEPLSPNFANDLESPIRMGSAGYWVLHEPRALVFEQESTSPREEFNRRRRMSAQGMLAMLTLPGALCGIRGWQFISHKFLRWLSLIPALMVFGATAVLARGSFFFQLLLIVQSSFCLCALGGLAMTTWARRVPHVFAVPFYVVLGLVGALVGVAESLMGRRFDIWEIPTSSRGEAVLDPISSTKE
jgi:biofilm PGA synthesis N-glycosyltransferase PgaC